MVFPDIRKRSGWIIFTALVSAWICAPVLVPSSAQADDRPRVVFINPGSDSEIFWSLVSQTMRAAAEQLEIDLVIKMAERDRKRMRQLALSSIQKIDRPDVLVLVNEEQAGASLLEAAHASGVNVLMLINDVVVRQSKRAGKPGTRLGNWIGSLVYNSRAMGQRLARALGAFAERNGLGASGGGDVKETKRPLVALFGDAITPGSIERNSGLHEVVAGGEYGLVVDHELMAYWDKSKAQILMARALAHYARAGTPRPVGVWAANAAMAMGAIAALREAGMEPGVDIGVAAANWSPDALNAVENGSMEVVEGGQYFSGAWAMVLLRDYFDGGGIAVDRRQVLVEMSSIDAGNISTFRKTIGAIIERRSFGDIDYSSFLVGPGGDAANYDFSLDALMKVVGTDLRTPG
ncbi:substrate-binding domain-containing protein [Breoghania sp.]|uniref:substrate-binding domain-containing protein n=1 Tax=Breoghania sp. TaxID=2065378 RepID=UPI0029C9D691|nr:substrate-binding domain-containing protein [Breoghania sp.]